MKRRLKFLLRLLIQIFAAIMGCFFACFRIREDLPTISTSSARSNSTDALISRNRFSSLSSLEREDSARNDGVGSQRDDIGLKDEAKFLKACGTLPGTPVEIRRASEKLKVSPSCGEDSEPPRFRSWLPNISVEKLQLDVQLLDQPTPIKLCQELGNSEDAFEHTPSKTSCIITNAQDTQNDSLDYMEGSWGGSPHTEKKAASVIPCSATETQKKNKSVRFECDTDLNKIKTPNNQNAYKPSPYPTPLKLFDEMQTPGTVYPASVEKSRDGKPRVRSQFVYPNDNPSENVFLCKILEEKDLNTEQDSSELSDYVKQAEIATPAPEKGLKKFANENESVMEASLSSWLRPESIDKLVGVVAAAQGNEDESSHISHPKWWNGNGIPNSTTKYKEDQRVKWHATPFEERLNKALVEGNVISQRKLVCEKPLAFQEIEESDTAL